MIPSQDVLNGVSVKVKFKKPVAAPLSNLSVTIEYLGVVFQKKSKTGSFTRRRHGLEGVGRDSCSATPLNDKLLLGEDCKGATAALSGINLSL